MSHDKLNGSAFACYDFIFKTENTLMLTINGASFMNGPSSRRISVITGTDFVGSLFESCL